jgi:hypothetical protein
LQRFDLFEFEDLLWFPGRIRQGMTDYLRFIMESLRAYDPAVPLLRDMLDRSSSLQIVDLCSGAGGGILHIAEALKVPVILTDRYPNIPAFVDLASKSPYIRYEASSVNAMSIPEDLKGLFTVFTAFHHFGPREAQKLLQAAVERKEPICIVEGAERSLAGALSMIVVIPLLALLTGPFVRPFSLHRLAFTYLIPLIPLCTMWDGFASFLKLYKPRELLELAKPFPLYRWEAGKLRHRLGSG